MTMTANAASRTVDRAEARERAKVKRALEKWLPLRRAQLALTSALDGVDAEHATELLLEWERSRGPIVDVEEAPAP